MTGRINNVDIMFYNDGNINRTLNRLEALGAEILNVFPAQPDRAFFDAIVRLDASQLDQVAQINTVLWLGYSGPEPIFDDEMSDQIVAGNTPGGTPVVGYNAHLADLGYDGSGVIWAIIDTGIDYAHPDLNTHIAGGFSYPGAPTTNPGDDCAIGGHGTHVAGIVGGDAAAGFSDLDGFLYGLGMAPGVSFFASNSLCAPAWPPAGGWQEHSKNAVLGSAIGGNNSWHSNEGTQHGYQASERTHDIMVRDGNFDTASTAEPFIEVFSAGNSGSGGLTAPKEGKNLIVTAASNNARAGDIEAIASFSSLGPAVDGRIVPTIAAPGASIASSRRLGAALQCTATIANTNGHYSLCSGTSMAAPHTSGAIVLITEWWRDNNSNANPSPAMAKALLVNGAVDMGTPDIPNNSEGWGRINVTNIISPTSPVVYRDQLDLFTGSGDQYLLVVGVVDPGQPLKITLAWSDAPGAVGANPALVNDLDLTVTVGGDTYLGNNFSGGWSVTGGAADTINNLENVYVQSPSGSVTIVVDATNIAGDGVPYNGDGTDQDFVLVCSNCALFPDFALSADPTDQAVCAPASAVYDLTVDQILGYGDNVTLSAVGNPAGTTTNFSTNPVTPPGTSELTIGNTGAATAGSYAIDVVGVAPTSTHTITLGLDLYTAVPVSPTLVAPADGAIDVGYQPTFSWNSVAQEDSYLFELATDAAFTNIVISETVATTIYQPINNLAPEATYYWRVTPSNICGDGAASSTFSFTVRTSELLSCGLAPVSFAEGIPVTWTVVDNTGGTGIVWTTVSDSACGIGNQTGGSGEAACADSDAAGLGAPAYNTELVTNVIDTTGFSRIDMDFNAYYRDLDTGNDLFKVDVWNGISWDNLLTWDSTHDGQSVSLDNIVALSDVQFRFTYSGDGFDWYAQVDDVSISCYGSELTNFLPIIRQP